MDLVGRLVAGARSWASLLVQPASAHCDTEDGPAVQDARRALETGNANIALKWVHAEGEAEVRVAFDKARAARGEDGADQAERQFLETLVRVHRAGEGAEFDGIKPTGTDLPPEVVAADAALEAGTIEPLRGLIPDDRWPELEKRFAVVLGKKGFDVDDLDAARDYVASYVYFYKYAEGEDGHDHAGGHVPHH
ncbi:MAG TPA: DUF6448 family protein [Ilumatobacteraceae bacterium]|jgi:hypothetical protein|nr:hypothetical protein [Microthrixaceae bacterium]HQZ37144.1 DUF6448 family protein [Ilumatobacteraceae bacterium]HRB05196.1 DUF6448 family protein [Ilumatobacteraceae bacterium]